MNDTGIPPNLWQWLAQSAVGIVLFLGGLIMRDVKQRLIKVEDSCRGQITQAYLDAQLRAQAEERRWMHEQNNDRFDALNERLDRVLDRE
jgi:hypothetical protein